MINERQQKDDMEALLKRPEFLRFIFELIQRGGVLEAAAHGSDERTFIAIGRRQLALEVLGMVDLGQPVAHPDKLPILTLLQVLREEASKPTENPNAKDRSSRHYRSDELADPEDDDADRA